MPYKTLYEQYNVFFFKVLFPAFIAVGIKIAIELKKNKMKTSLLNVLLSLLIGIGGAYISSDVILDTFQAKYISIVIAIVAIISDKIGEWLIFKFKVDIFLTSLVEVFISALKQKQ